MRNPRHLAGVCLCGGAINNDAHFCEFGDILDGVAVDTYPNQHPTVCQCIDVRNLVVVEKYIVQFSQATQCCDGSDFVV